LVQSLDELGVLHAEDREVETQQIGVHPRRQHGEIVGKHRLAKLGAQRIARQHRLPILRVLGCEVGLLQIKEKLAEPVIRHAIPKSGRTRRQYCPLGSRPSAYCPYIVLTASQFMLTCTAAAWASRQARCSGLPVKMPCPPEARNRASIA